MSETESMMHSEEKGTIDLTVPKDEVVKEFRHKISSLISDAGALPVIGAIHEKRPANIVLTPSGIAFSIDIWGKYADLEVVGSVTLSVSDGHVKVNVPFLHLRPYNLNWRLVLASIAIPSSVMFALQKGIESTLSSAAIKAIEHAVNTELHKKLGDQVRVDSIKVDSDGITIRLRSA